MKLHHRDAAQRYVSSELESTNGDEDEQIDPRFLSSLLERVLQKVSQLPGALEAISSDPQLLHDLQEHELLFYPTQPQLEVQERHSMHLSESHLDLSEIESEMNDSVDLTSEQFGSEYEAELLAVESMQRKSTSLDIPRRMSSTTSTVAIPISSMNHGVSASPSYSMGMLSMSPGLSSQDGDPVSAVWPRRPNEFAFSQPDEGKEDELYNEVVFSEHEDDEGGDDKVFGLDDIDSHTNSNDDISDDDDDEIEYDTMRLRVIRERNRTGFGPSQEFNGVPGMVVAGQYHIDELLGEAVFSQTYKTTDTRSGFPVCLKVIRNVKSYFDQGIDEIRILEYINVAGDPEEHHILRLVDYFYFKEHLVIVTELLNENLYEFSKLSKSQEGHTLFGNYFTIPRLKKIAIQCLQALQFLHALHIVHCDLKPENIVMKNIQKCEIKIIDFGSASFTSEELTYYIQSRSYRAPEVILGLRYDERIDLWSLGCILAEMYTGQVLFQNNSTTQLLSHIVGLLGNIPSKMLMASPEANKYFTKDYILYSTNNKTLKREFIIPTKKSLWHVLNCGDRYFIEFLIDLLKIDPTQRMSATTALQHPWLKTNIFILNDF